MLRIVFALRGFAEPFAGMKVARNETSLTHFSRDGLQ